MSRSKISSTVSRPSSLPSSLVSSTTSPTAQSRSVARVIGIDQYSPDGEPHLSQTLRQSSEP